MTDEQKATILAKITTRDEAGRHFTEVYSAEELEELEEAGFIWIKRPVYEFTRNEKGRATRMSEEFWSVQISWKGQALVDAYPECWPTE